MLYDLADVNQHIVDLNRSKWDPKRSDKAKGIYYFEPGQPKVYIKKSDYEDSASRPKHILKFIDVDRLPYNRAKFGAEPVTIHDPYWPEPMVPNAEGQYVIMDALLVKIADMESYIDYRQAERNRGNTGMKEEGGSFSSATASGGVALKDSDISNIDRQKQ